jgi:hypothetical protein
MGEDLQKDPVAGRFLQLEASADDVKIETPTVTPETGE